MENNIFREKSMQRISSPEQMDDYLRVTNPSIWIILAAVIFLLVSLIVWSTFVSIESRITGTASVSENVMTLQLDDDTAAGTIETGMQATVGGIDTTITYIGRDAQNALLIGTETKIPDGVYEVSILYRTTKVIQMLFQ